MYGAWCMEGDDDVNKEGLGSSNVVSRRLGWVVCLTWMRALRFSSDGWIHVRHCVMQGGIVLLPLAISPKNATAVTMASDCLFASHASSLMMMMCSTTLGPGECMRPAVSAKVTTTNEMFYDTKCEAARGFHIPLWAIRRLSPRPERNESCRRSGPRGEMAVAAPSARRQVQSLCKGQ